MPLPNISKLKLKELYELQDLVDKKIEEMKEDEKKKLIDKMRALSISAGLELEDVVGSIVGIKTKKKKKEVVIKYRNPDEETETWSGRGRKPKWLEKSLKEGKKLEDFLIEKG